jgi:hypothetical protein
MGVMMVGCMVVRRDKSQRSSTEFRVDMGMVSARVLMVQGANLREPKRHQKGANQEHHHPLAASVLSAQDCHA